jgi:hypothetical protein
LKQTYKARITQAQSAVDVLANSMRSGFEYRQKECRVEFRPNEGKKAFFVVETGEPVGVEDMTNEDMQQELFESESAFDHRSNLQLWQIPSGSKDQAMLVVGKSKELWYSALRVRVGVYELQERLDSEQKAFKHRADAVTTSAKRVMEWLKANVRDLEEGFEPSIKQMVELEKDKAE